SLCVSAYQLLLYQLNVQQPDEYKMKGVEEVKYMRGDENRVNARNQENLVRDAHTQKHTPSQQEFFRMLDEKIEKGRDYCSEEEAEDGT
uniref:Uncharacterized protein n=1 Tax=Seriola lalandi dorsalis TaxID=1841481 RepID=A0A3B4Y485_SERLL